LGNLEAFAGVEPF